MDTALEVNKKIYMTYKKSVPDIVFNRWKTLNPDYSIEFSLDSDCISFIEEHFNEHIASLFKSIPVGMYKADLWRLCKLYVHGGVYADVDLVPYLNIDTLDPNVTFYSCLSCVTSSIFQAFMKSKAKSPLIFIFILSFLMNLPFSYHLGPTYDMYKCIQYNINTAILPEVIYNLEEVKIPIQIGTSQTNIKNIDLHYFPEGLEHIIKLKENHHKDAFEFSIRNNILMVRRLDNPGGWMYNHSIDICIKSRESILLFKENMGPNNNWVTSYISHNSMKIFDSRDLNYFHNKGW